MTASQDDALERDAARWLLRLAGCAPDDPLRTRFESWLACSPRHAAAYARMQQVWDAVDDGPSLERMAARAAGDRPDAAPPTSPAAPSLDRIAGGGADDRLEAALRRARRRTAGGLLGVVAIGLLGGLALRRLSPWPPAAPLVGRLSAPPGTTAHRQRLPDGTWITLLPGSQAETRYDALQRDCRLLRGEAEFEVAADAGRPFVVHAGAGEVRVVGTRFVVERLVDGGARVSVLQGVVRVGAAGGPPAATLGVGEVQRCDAAGRWAVDRRPVSDALAWRGQHLVLDGASLDEVVDRLGRLRTRPLRLTGPVPARRLTAVVQWRDVDDFIAQLPRLAGVRVEEKADATWLIAPPTGAGA